MKWPWSTSGSSAEKDVPTREFDALPALRGQETVHTVPTREFPAHVDPEEIFSAANDDGRYEVTDDELEVVEDSMFGPPVPTKSLTVPRAVQASSAPTRAPRAPQHSEVRVAARAPSLPAPSQVAALKAGLPIRDRRQG